MRQLATIESIKAEFNNITRLKMFEIQVIDKRTNEIDYIIFDIEIDGNNLRAEHVALTEEEEQSNLIAAEEIEIDVDFPLDQNLEVLYEACTDAILNSDFYELGEE